jgi:hypothetical protein
MTVTSQPRDGARLTRKEERAARAKKGSPMSEILQELTIEATPENVFHAITLPEGITGWWTNQVTAGPKVGTLTEIRFKNGEVMKKAPLMGMNGNEPRNDGNPTSCAIRGASSIQYDYLRSQYF